MTPVELSRTVLRAVRRAVDDGELSVTVPERAVVTEPGPGGAGTSPPPSRCGSPGRPGSPRGGWPRSCGAAWSAPRGSGTSSSPGRGSLNITLDERADPVAGLVAEIREKGARYGHGDALAGQVVALRVPYEVRAEVVADAVVRLVRTQGGRATVEHGEPANLRPVPAPEDPAPLGPDAARWALLHPAPHDRPRITADHLVQREGNPLFRVRYAHARVRSVSRNAGRLGFAAEPGPPHTEAGAPCSPPSPTTPASSPGPPPTVPPDRLARHLVTVADAVLPLLPSVLPVGEEKPSAAHRARLALAEAAGTVLAGGLSLLGIDAPEHL